MPTWDDAKRQLNVSQHGLDFVGCEAEADNGQTMSADELLSRLRRYG
jgi:uncharacterized DUF497 family protein